MRIFFELPENPKSTSQEKGVSVVRGKVHHYEKKNVREMRERYRHEIFKFFYTNKMQVPHFDGAVYFSVTFTYSIKDKKRWGQPKTSRPDADNIVKLLLDVCSDLEMWPDDAVVADLHVRKLWGDKPSVRITIEPLEVIKTYDTV